MLHELNVDGGRGQYDPTVSRLSDATTEGYELLTAFLHWHREHRNSADETIAGYKSVLGQWIVHMSPRSVLDATRADLEGFVERPRLRRGEGSTGAPATRRRDVTVLKGFYKWLVGDGKMARNPATNLAAPKVRRKEPRPVPRDVWLDTWHQEMPPMLRVTLGLGHFVGLRRGEISNLRGDHFRDDNKIKGFVRKGGGEHTVPWLDMVETVMWKMPEHKTKWTELFVDELRDIAMMTWDHHLLSPWSQNLSVNTVNRQYEKFGIPFTPHRTRDSCATNLVEHCGTPVHIVCELLNHGSIQVTMGYVKVAANSLATWRGTQQAQDG